MTLLQIYQWVCQWKNFENRSTFGEVTDKSIVACFFDSQCTSSLAFDHAPHPRTQHTAHYLTYLDLYIGVLCVESSIFLRQVGVPILDNNRCQKHYFANLVPSKQICAGTADEHTCRGDSGGPLVCKHSGKWWQYGIVSYGKKYCVTTRYPSVYTDVVAHLRWIQQTSGSEYIHCVFIL